MNNKNIKSNIKIAQEKAQENLEAYCKNLHDLTIDKLSESEIKLLYDNMAKENNTIILLSDAQSKEKKIKDEISEDRVILSIKEDELCEYYVRSTLLKQDLLQSRLFLLDREVENLTNNLASKQKRFNEILVGNYEIVFKYSLIPNFKHNPFSNYQSSRVCSNSSSLKSHSNNSLGSNYSGSRTSPSVSTQGGYQRQVPFRDFDLHFDHDGCGEMLTDLNTGQQYATSDLSRGRVSGRSFSNGNYYVDRNSREISSPHQMEDEGW